MKLTVNTPEGTRDRLFSECQERRQVQSRLIRLFRQRGYLEVSTPETEYYDLFALSGSAIPQERMLKVGDPSGKICVMRPDSTTPIARCGCHKAPLYGAAPEAVLRPEGLPGQPCPQRQQPGDSPVWC